jgi:hypothetical protein
MSKIIGALQSQKEDSVAKNIAKLKFSWEKVCLDLSKKLVSVFILYNKRLVDTTRSES